MSQRKWEIGEAVLRRAEVACAAAYWLSRVVRDDLGNVSREQSITYIAPILFLVEETEVHMGYVKWRLKRILDKSLGSAAKNEE